MVYNSITKTLRAAENRIDYSLFTSEGYDGDEITISFETPVRIKINDRLSSDIPFNILIKRLSERVLLLSHFHCDAELEGFEGFVKGSDNVETAINKLRWIDWERYSNRQQTKMKFGGLIGEITYRSDFHKYLPLLRLGEHIHVGKATTFGLGKYWIADLGFRISDLKIRNRNQNPQSEINNPKYTCPFGGFLGMKKGEWENRGMGDWGKSHNLKISLIYK